MWTNLNLANSNSRSAELAPIPMIGVYGSITPEQKSAAIDMVVIGENDIAQEETKSAFGIRLIDQNNNPLATYELELDDLEGDDDHGPAHLFGQVVPFVDGTTTVQIVELDLDTVWATYSISSQPPTISNLAIDNLNVDSLDPDHVKTYELSWDASDPEGDPLTFNLFYSNDNGASFEPLKLGLTDSTAEVSSRNLPGGQGVFKVIVSDGAYEVEAQTDPFTAPAQEPFATITQPTDDTTVQWGQLVTLSGEAFDYQDEGIAWEKFEWSNQAGLLGTGGELELSNLPIGENIITLKVTNSHNLSDETSIKIMVEDNLAQPGPTPAVGPESLSWHLDAIDTSPLQEASQIYKILEIYNLGSGDLGDWSVENPVEWLSVVHPLHVGPPTAEKTAGIQVTVHPGLIEPGEVLTTQLIFTFGGTEDKPVVVPVSVARGAIGPGFDAPDLPPGPSGPSADSQIFLPLIGR
ncbi:MAG: hypothetical protein AB8G95_11075 [Anaerolineae bacterium]